MKVASVVTQASLSVCENWKRQTGRPLALAILCSFLVPLVASSFHAISGAASPPRPTPTIVEFPVEKRGAVLTVPLSFGNKAYPFMLDTGFSCCAFDDRFSDQLGPEIETKVGSTPAGLAEMKFHKPPPSRLGPFRLATTSCAVLPMFHDHFEPEGLDLYGVVGMDALKDKIFTIDFDQGTVRFIEAVTRDAGTAVALKWDRGAVFATAEVEGLGKEDFLIDTGQMGFSTGSLRQQIFEQLLAARRLRPVGSDRDSILTALGPVAISLRNGRIDGLSLCRFRHRGLIMNESRSKVSSFGLGYLSRYIVTFDMPRSTMYLRPGKEFHRADRYDLAGVAIFPFDTSAVLADFVAVGIHMTESEIKSFGKRVIVAGLVAGSAGEAAGLKRFDAIVSIDDMSADRTTIFEFMRLFATPGQRRVVFERDGVRKEITILLRDDVGQINGADKRDGSK